MCRKPLVHEMNGANSSQIPIPHRMIYYSSHLNKRLLTPHEMYTTGFNLLLDCPHYIRMGFDVTLAPGKQRRISHAFGWSYALICAVRHYEQGRSIQLVYERVPEGFQ